MAFSSSSSSYLIKFHRGGVFVRDPFSYHYEMVSEIPNVDMATLNFVGLRTLRNDEDLAQCVDLGGKNGYVLYTYICVSHNVFGLHDATSSSQQDVGNVEQNDDSDNDLDDDYTIFEVDSDSEESDTASVDHLFDGEEEVYDVRTRKPVHEPKKCKKYESPDQLKRALACYALAIGYKLYYEVNNPRRLLAKCCRDEKDRKCPFRLWASWMQNEKNFQIKKLINGHACSRTSEYGTLSTSNWIARNYVKKIMINPCIKFKEIIDLILKKYKCKVTVSQSRKGKMKALQQYETCFEDHYGMLWSYASEILNSNPGSTCKMSVDSR
ncbi:hypothetical protein Tco_0598627 [Tanacetum coccineum]